MEPFSDGVIAIVITIMVLELKPPHGASAGTLRTLLPASPASRPGWATASPPRCRSRSTARCCGLRRS
jgi:hypothetical protein